MVRKKAMELRKNKETLHFILEIGQKIKKKDMEISIIVIRHTIKEPFRNQRRMALAYCLMKRISKSTRDSGVKALWRGLAYFDKTKKSMKANSFTISFMEMASYTYQSETE